jgi:hypothetical protein
VGHLSEHRKDLSEIAFRDHSFLLVPKRSQRSFLDALQLSNLLK